MKYLHNEILHSKLIKINTHKNNCWHIQQCWKKVTQIIYTPWYQTWSSKVVKITELEPQYWQHIDWEINSSRKIFIWLMIKQVFIYVKII